MDYLAKRKNFYSQNGEDGIIEEILCRIPKSEKNSWCVEFGAWDGKHMSNTFHLVESAKYAAIYIEGNSEYFEKLIINPLVSLATVPSVCKTYHRDKCRRRQPRLCLAVAPSPTAGRFLCAASNSQWTRQRCCHC